MESARRVFAALLAVAAIVATAPPAVAEEAPAAPQPVAPAPQVPLHQVRRINVFRHITFPLVGPAKFGHSFGLCRDNCTREHHGVDIFTYGWKGVPVVAAQSGIVEKAEIYGKESFCSVYVRGFDGWETRYVHLNTDSQGTDDGAWGEGCLAPGIEVGAFVEEGQLLGWIGDSGNAETTAVHLHFEIRTPRGLPVDPWKSLRYATRIRYTTVDASDPVGAAVAVSRVVYPNGSHVAFVTTVDDSADDGIGLPWSAPMAGPVLVTRAGGLDPATRAELVRLAPDVIVVLERSDLPSRGLTMELGTLAMAVEHVPFPKRGATAAAARIPGRTHQLATIEDARFRVVIVEDGGAVSTELETALSNLDTGIPLLRLVQGEAISRSRGLSDLTGPGRSGRRRTLYYPAGTRWVSFPVAEPPEAIPDTGIVIVAGDREVTTQTLTFLRSLAAAPQMALWR